MKNLYLIAIAAGLMICSSGSIKAQNPGFKTCYFSKSVVSAILNQEGCAGIRVYPVVSTNGQKSTIIIGLNRSGEEIYNSSSSAGMYQMWTSGTSSVPMNEQNALSSCNAYAGSNTAFVADISASSIQSVLSGNSAGVAISYINSSEGNFGAQSFSEPRNPNAYGEMKPGDPCPSACGVASHYLRYPK